MGNPFSDGYTFVSVKNNGTNCVVTNCLISLLLAERKENGNEPQGIGRIVLARELPHTR